MNHVGTITIITNRLILRPFKLSDIEDAFTNWCSDDQVTKYLRWTSHSNIEVTKKVITDWISNYKRPDYYQWAIEYKQDCKVIGTIGVNDKDEQLAAVDIGYCLGKKWWNQGIVSEAFSAIIQFFFEIVGTNRIQAQHDLDNYSSGKVMIKCGMTFEGILRQAYIDNQGIVDVCIYSILSEEYKGRKFFLSNNE